MKDDESTPVQIERPVYKLEELNKEHLYQKPYKTRKYVCIFADSYYVIFNINDKHFNLKYFQLPIHYRHQTFKQQVLADLN